jgi:thioredoxin-like negative regulator of GroEL
MPLLFVLLLSAAWCGSAAAQVRPAALAPRAVPWQTDLKKAHELSVATGKPLLIVFGAEWCGFCHKLEQTTLADPAMVEYVSTEFIPVHIDYDKQPRVAQILEVKSLPHTVVLSPEANLLGRIVGFAEATKYRNGLEQARALQDRVRTASAP